MAPRFRLGLLIVLALVATQGQARQGAPPAAGALVEAPIASTALKGNLLGDPTDLRVSVYLPPRYATSPTRRYPTLYLLHGYLSDAGVFGAREGGTGYQGMQLAATMDELIELGAAREMIVVVPNSHNAYFGSFYTDSPVTGGWKDFIVKEVVSLVDATYRTIARPESRGIAGHSMGGYGAIMLAMQHPDVFGALYALSPCCVGLEADLGADNHAWLTTLKIQSRDQLKRRPQSFEEFYYTAFIALAAALSPNPDKGPLFVDLPFEQRQNRVVPHESAYAKWRSKMPLYLVEQYRGNLVKLRGIYLDYGALEEFSHIRVTTQALSEELASRGIAHTFEIYADGDHSSKIRERIETRVLPFFSRVLTQQ